jgi:hypothetical protein
VRGIVHDFGLGVNEYADLGRKLPAWKPPVCPVCNRPTLRGHGVRRRAVWFRDQTHATELFLRRLLCKGCPGAEVGRKSVVLTVYPPFVHSHKRYPLTEIEDVVKGRYVSDQSYPALELAHTGVAQSTQHAWCQGFTAAAMQWSSSLTAWLSARQPTTLIRLVTRGPSHALLVMAALLTSSDWQPLKTETHAESLVRLWLWGGGVRGLGALLPPTRSRKVVRGPTC